VGYSAGMWRDFGEAVAALAGALTGLLFVAVSIKSQALADSLSLRARAGQTLVLFMTAVILSLLLVAPQPAAALGPELLATALVSGATLFTFDRLARRGGRESDSRLARYIDKASPNLVTALLIVAAGISFILKGGGGLYWIMPAVVACLVGGVTNDWLFLVVQDG